MYAGFSGNSRVCTRVSVETISYVCGVSVETVAYVCTGSSGQFGRSVQANVGSSTGDISRSYRWSTTDLLVGNLSQVFR
jgi:hypothetical protein